MGRPVQYPKVLPVVAWELDVGNGGLVTRRMFGLREHSSMCCSCLVRSASCCCLCRSALSAADSARRPMMGMG